MCALHCIALHCHSSEHKSVTYHSVEMAENSPNATISAPQGMKLKDMCLAEFGFGPSVGVKWAHPWHAMNDVASTQVLVW